MTEAEDKISALESFGVKDENGGELKLKTILHASGMAAISTLLLAKLKTGDKILSHFSLYGGVYAVTRVRRVAEALTPEGLADRLAGLSLGLHLFTAEVRAGMAEKETEVRERLAVASPGAPPRLLGPTPAPEHPESDTSATTREGTH